MTGMRDRRWTHDPESPTLTVVDGHGAGRLVPTPAGRVWVETEGSGPAVVLVPGGPGAAHAHYHPWFSALAARRTVVYLDQLGTGRSDRLADPAGYGVGLYADTLGVVLDAVGAGRAHLVGISFGGVPAAEFAARHPERTRSLTLVDAQVDAEGWQSSNVDRVNREVADLWPDTWAQLQRLRDEGVLSGDPRYQDLLAPALEVLEWRRPDHPALRRDPASAFDVGTYRAFLGGDPEWVVGGALAGHTVLDRLRPHRLPTLVLTGRHDRVTVPAVAARTAAALGLGAEALHVFEDSAHRPWAEEPEAFTAVLTAFLDRCEAAAGP